MPQPEVLSRPSRAPDAVLSYGDDADGVADVRLPATRHSRARAPSAPALPLILLLHGGYWRVAHDRVYLGPLADALADSGFVVCTPEYRRVGQVGGGWPGTFADVAAAVKALPSQIADVAGDAADVGRIILAGHSAGGHLAIWSAAQPGIGAGSGGSADQAPLAVVSLAGVCDLTRCAQEHLDDNAAEELMGGAPEAFPDRYAAADPMRLTPIGAPMMLLHGTADDRVPWEYSRDFAANAQARGDEIVLTLMPGFGHFELVDPLSSAWPTVLGAFHAAAARLGQT